MRRLWKPGELFLCALQGRRVDLVVFGREPPTREHPAGFPTYPVPQTHLPYTSSNLKRPPRLGQRRQRGVPYTVVIVSTRRVDWYPRNRRWGPRLARCTCRIDSFRISTNGLLELAAISQTKRIFLIFPPTLEQNRPTLY